MANCLGSDLVPSWGGTENAITSSVYTYGMSNWFCNVVCLKRNYALIVVVWEEQVHSVLCQMLSNL